MIGLTVEAELMTAISFVGKAATYLFNFKTRLRL